MPRSHLVAAGAALTFAMSYASAAAFGNPLHRTEERVSEPAHTAAETDERPSFIAMPIPISDPAIGTGLAGVAMALYNAGADNKPWTTGFGGLYTDSESWAVALFHRSHHDNDRYRVSGGLAYGVFNVDFFGIGHNAGARESSIGLEQQGEGLQLDGMIRVRPNTYLGMRYRGVSVDTLVTSLDLPSPDLDLPPIELQSTTSALGLVGEYDTRDSQFGTRNGLYLTANAIYAAESLSSDFEYPRTEFALNGYHPLGAMTLAWRGSMCWAGDDAPFYDLCNYGSSNDLRGYTTGQYRDHAMFAVQAELRAHLFWRIGATAFAGVGGVAPDFGAFESDELLPAAGVGLRIEASRRFRVNLSIDYAVGDNSSALYFYVGEAF